MPAAPCRLRKAPGRAKRYPSGRSRADWRSVRAPCMRRLSNRCPSAQRGRLTLTRLKITEVEAAEFGLSGCSDHDRVAGNVAVNHILRLQKFQRVDDLIRDSKK